MDKRLRIIIQPAVQHLQSVHKSLGCGTEIRFPVFEFIVAKGRIQCLFIKTVLYNFSKHLFHGFHKLFFLLFIRILGYNAEIGLLNAVFVNAVNIRTDAFFQKRSL